MQRISSTLSATWEILKTTAALTTNFSSKPSDEFAREELSSDVRAAAVLGSLEGQLSSTAIGAFLSLIDPLDEGAVMCATTETLVKARVDSRGFTILATRELKLAGDCVAMSASRSGDLAVCGPVSLDVASESDLIADDTNTEEGRGRSPEARDGSSKKKTSTFEGGHESMICSMAASPDGYLATGGQDSCVALWHVSKPKPLYIIRGHQDWVKHLQFSAGKGTADSDEQHSETDSSATLPPTTSTLMSFGDDGLVLTSAVPSGTEVRRLMFERGKRVFATAHNFDGRLLILSRDEVGIEVHDACASEVKPSLVVTPHGNSLATCLQLSSDESLLFSGGEDERVVITKLSDASVVGVCDSFVSARRCVSFMTCVTSLRVLAYPPDSDLVVVLVGASDGTLAVWTVNPATGYSKGVRRVELELGPVVSIV